MGRKQLLVATAALLFWLCPAWALAIEVPGINGHMTDPDHTLSDSDKTAAEDMLGKIQEDTRIDVAGWIVDAPDSQLDDLGNEAYRKWNIGRDWDNGVFLIVPKSGRVHVIQNRTKPALTTVEARRVVDADSPSSPMAQRLTKIAEAAGGIVRNNALRARPAGQNDPADAMWYACGAGAVLLIAAALTYRARARRATPQVPHTD
jgi:uncharacterized membrane protein YgcG